MCDLLTNPKKNLNKFAHLKKRNGLTTLNPQIDMFDGYGNYFVSYMQI